MSVQTATPTVTDRVITRYWPGWGLKRLRARTAAAAIGAMASGFRSARQTRLQSDWVPTLGSADTDALRDLDTLRAKSRDLVRMDSYAQVLGSIVDHVVGTGLVPHSRVNAKALGITEAVAEDFQEQAELAFSVWMPFADARRQLDFYGLQELAYRSMLEDGEWFGRRISVDEVSMQALGMPYSVAYEMIDPDRVVSPNKAVFQKLGGRTEHTVRHGIEVNVFGAPVAYWVLKRHPAERGFVALRGRSNSEFVRVPASRMIHLFRPLRVGQTRGIPHMAPELNTFEMINRLFEAELVTALVVACHSIFIKKDSAAEYAATVAPITNDRGQREETLEPGTKQYLNPGEDVVAFSPNRPSNTFPPFVEILLRKMATGLGITYEQLAKDFTKTNFSSGRQAAMLAQKFFNREQRMVARVLAQPVWRDVLREAAQAGDLPRISEINRSREPFYFNATWSGPGYGYIEPTKEVAAAKAGVDMGISTLERECAKLGLDWRDVLAQRAREQRKAEELGVTLDGPAAVVETLGAVRGYDDEDRQAA